MRKRAGIYGRNSKGEAKSIEDQLELGEEAVVEKGWILAGKYQDDSSASIFRTTERKNWLRLLADLQARLLDVVILWKAARGSRDEIDWFPLLRTCAEHGVLIHILSEDRDYDPSDDRDWKTLADEGISASYYSRQLSKDVRRGVSKNAVKGAPHGRSWFGYDARYDEKTKRPLRTPNKDAATVLEIFQRIDKLTSLVSLEREFEERGIVSAAGKPLSRTTIGRIARNVAYIGIRRHRQGDRRTPGQDYAAQWDGIIDEALFWRVQKILDSPDRKKTKPGKAKYLLTCIAVAPCGGPMSFKPGRGDGRVDRLGCNKNGCTSIAEDAANAVVGRMIFARLARPDARALLLKPDEGVAQAHAELSRYETQLEAARQSYEKPDGISEEALARKERALLPLIAAAKERTRPKGETNQLIDELLASSDRAKAWAGLEMGARRAIVRGLADLRVAPSLGQLKRGSTFDDRVKDAVVRLGGSRWIGDTRTWAEIAAGAGV